MGLIPYSEKISPRHLYTGSKMLKTLQGLRYVSNGNLWLTYSTSRRKVIFSLSQTERKIFKPPSRSSPSCSGNREDALFPFVRRKKSPQPDRYSALMLPAISFRFLDLA